MLEENEFLEEDELQQVVEEIRVMLMKAMLVKKMIDLSKSYLRWKIIVSKFQEERRAM